MKRKMWWYKRSSWPHLLARWLMLFATTGYVLLPTSVVWANPTGEQVVGGSATFDRQGNTLTVNQATDRLAVNWQDFSIAGGETTHFNMPSSASIALNRVLGGNPSQIYGTLSSNGNIILVNNAGIFVGPGGVVNAASFVGSTLDIDPGQFMNAGAGGYHLHGDSYAPIVNQGNITAEKGDVFLIAQKVENRGTIAAPNGRAALVGTGRAADRTEVVLHEVGGSGFAVRVAQLEGEAAQGMNGDLPDGEELLNEGEIAAAQAELNASGNIYALAIKNTGIIKAKAVVAQADGTVRLDGGVGDVRNTGTLIAKNAGAEATAAGGKIEVVGQNVTASPESVITAAGGVQGGDGGRVKIDSADTTIVQGKVDVTAPSAGAKGGKVELLGERVGLFDGAKVDASGGAGGGTVLVGGDYLGGRTPAESLRGLVELEDEAVKNAKATVMAETAEIKADATVNGDGGKIILWSDEYTGFYGELFARGAGTDGDGGFVETSSLLNLQAWGSVRVGSELGSRGLWLLDPLDVTISNAATSGGTPSPYPISGGSWSPNAINATVNADEISQALLNGSSVTITTAGSAIDVDGDVVNQTGNMTVAAAITDNPGGGAPGGGSLSLTADASITINSAITLSTGSITISANGGRVTVGAGLTTTTGAINITAGGGTERDLNVNAGVSITSTTGNINLTSGNGGSININGSVLTGGNVTLNSAVSISLAGIINVSGATGLGVGAVTLSSPAGGNGQITGGGTISLPARQTASEAFLTVRTDNAIDINVSTGVEATIGDLGPTITMQSRNGSITLDNLGDSGSTLTAGRTEASTGIDMRAGDGNLIVLGQFTTGSGQTYLRSAEPTAGVIFQTPSTRLFPIVIGPGGIILDGVVTLNTGGLTVLSGAGIQFRSSVNDGSIAVTPDPADPSAAVKSIIPTDREQLLLISTGASAFESFVGTAQAYDTTGALANFLSLGPLASFRTEGGSLNFRATATAVSPANPPTLGNLFRPSIFVSGPVTFDNTALVLEANTYITATGKTGATPGAVVPGGDILFGGTIDSAFADNAPILVVETLDDDGDPDTAGGGQIVFNAAVGGAVPLGGVMVRARGFRNLDDDPSGFAQTKDAQIAVNGGIATIPGTNPLQSGAFGQVVLEADGAVVIASSINTRGGVSQTFLTGDVQITTNLTERSGRAEDAPENVAQLEGQIQTRGGRITFGRPAGVNPNLDLLTGRLFVTGSSTLDTYTENAQGDITIRGEMNGAPGTTLATLAGSGDLTFGSPSMDPAAGDYAIGGISILGLTISSANNITIYGNVRMGGDFLFDNLTGIFDASEISIDGRWGLTINPINDQPAGLDSKIILGRIGQEVALASLTIGVPTSKAVKLTGNITTAGGAVLFRAPVVIAKDDPSAGDVDRYLLQINTTANGSNSGGAITFEDTLNGDGVAAPREILLRAGTSGAVSLLKNVGDVNPLTYLDINSAGSIAVGLDQTITVQGDILITPRLLARGQTTTMSFFALEPLFPTRNFGDLTFLGGADISGVGVLNNASQLTLEAYRNLRLGNVEMVGGTPIGLQSGPGGNAGTLILRTQTGQITLDGLNASGGSGDALVGGYGGRGGTLQITMEGDKNIFLGTIVLTGGTGTVSANGGNAGEIRFEEDGEGENYNLFLRGNIAASGGAGGSGVVAGTGGKAAVIDFSKQNLIIDVPEASITALGGRTGTSTFPGSSSGGRGIDGNLTFGRIFSTDGRNNSILMDVGAGRIDFQDAIGPTDGSQLGVLQIVNAQTVNFLDAASVNAQRLIQLASVPTGGLFVLNQIGTTTFGAGALNLSAAGTALSLTGFNFILGGAINTLANNGNVLINNFGNLRITGDSPNLGGNFTQTAGQASATVTLSADLTSAGGAIAFASPVRLGDDVILSNRGNGLTPVSGGAITFASTLNSDGSTARNLVLESGGTVTFGGLVGNLNALASLQTDAGGSVVLAAADASRALPSLNVSGAVSIADQLLLEEDTVIRANAFTLEAGGLLDGANDLLMLLNAGAFTLNGQVGRDTPLGQLRLEGGSGVVFGFNGTEGSPSVFTTGNQYYEPDVLLDAGLNATVVLAGGSFDFFGLIDGANGLVLNSAGEINLYQAVGSVTALDQFRTVGAGSLNLRVLGSTALNPTIFTTGTQLYRGPLSLFANSFLKAGSDMYFGGLVGIGTGTPPPIFGVETFDATPGDAGGGQIIFDGAIGAAGNALGGFQATARGFRNLEDDPATPATAQTKDAQISINSNLFTFAGVNPVNPGAFGQVVIQADGAVVISGIIDTRGTTDPTVITGDVRIAAGQTLRRTAPENLIQLQGSILTRGGSVTFGDAERGETSSTGDIFLTGASTIDTGADNAQGFVDFQGTINGGSTLVINAGAAEVTFSENIGADRALTSLTVSDASQVTLRGNITTTGGILLGGPTVLDGDATDLFVFNTTARASLGGGITFLGTLTGSGSDVTINAGQGVISLAEEVSGIDELRIESGGGFSFTGNSAITAGEIVIVPDVDVSTFQESNTGTSGIRITAERNLTLLGGVTARPVYGAGLNVNLQAGGNLNITGSIFASGRSGTFIGFAPDGSTFTFATVGYNGGNVHLKGNAISVASVDASGSNNFATGGNGGNGGSVIFEAAGAITVGAINVGGGTDGVLGGRGGSIQITRTGATGAMNIGTLSAIGGDSNNGVGASGGTISVVASLGNLVAPTDFRLAGGGGSQENPDGTGGTVTLRADAGSISFASQNLELDGDASLVVRAAGNLILATTPGTTPERSSGGVVITLNDTATRIDRRGSMTFSFGSGVSQSEFFMPTSAYLISNGGDIQIDTQAPGGAITPGKITISGMVTSSDNVNGGRVLINQSAGLGGVGAVTVGNAIETSGGNPTDPRYGRAGGQVLISGTDVTLNRIVTSGSDSLATATVPAFGGAGGDITVTASGVLTLRRNLLTTGGNGLAVTGGDGTGGAGGTVQLNGNVVLNSADAGRTTILVNTTGGTGQGDGDPGLGGNISWARATSGTAVTFRGTTSSSNALDLRYGSGTVTLGNASSDTLTLGELVSAADEARSTGLLQVYAALNLETLTTYARGYSIELLGGGTVETNTQFLNTGYVRIGSAGITTTFTGGLNTQAGPSSTVLAGTLQTATEVSDATLLFGNVQLAGATTLNTFGNTLSIGMIDSIGSAYDLTLAAGIGNGTVLMAGNIGGNVGSPSVLTGQNLVAPGRLTLNGGRGDNSGPIIFGGTLNLASMETASGVDVTFTKDVTLSGASTFRGGVALNNVGAAESPGTPLTMTLGGGTSFQAVSLSGGLAKISVTSGTTTFQTVDGSQRLILAGAGTKQFNGAVGGATSGGLGSGSLAAIDLQGGEAVFGSSLTTAGGITSAVGTTMTLGGNVTLNAGDGTPTSLAGTVKIGAVTITAVNAATLSGTTTLEGNATLAGAGSYRLAELDSATVNVVGVPPLYYGLALQGAGQKRFTGAVTVGGMSQSKGTGTAIFDGALALGGTPSRFNGGVTTFDSTVVLGSALTAAVGVTARFGTSSSVSFGQTLILEGDGALIFQPRLQGGSHNLTVAGSGSRSFAQGLTAGQLTQSGTQQMLLGGQVEVLSASLGKVLLSSSAFSSSGDVILNDVLSSQGNSSLASDSANQVYGSSVEVLAGTLTLSGPTLQRNTQLDFRAARNSRLVVNGNFSGADTVAGGNTTLITGQGAKVFSHNLTADTLRQQAGSGAVTMQGAVTIASGDFDGAIILENDQAFSSAGDLSFSTLTVNGSKAGVDKEISVLGDLAIDSTLTLNRNLEILRSSLTSLSKVVGRGNLLVEAEGIDLTGAVSNAGSFTAVNSTGILLQDSGGYITGFGNLASRAGVNIASLSGDVEVNGLTAVTDLNLAAANGNIVLTAMDSSRSLGVATSGSVDFSGGGNRARALSNLFAQSAIGLNADNLQLQSLGNVSLEEGGLVFTPQGNLTLAGIINVPGQIILQPSGLLVNASGRANPFQGGGGTILVTQDLFSPNLQSILIPGATLIRGRPPGDLAARVGGLAAEAGGVTIYYESVGNLLPYSREFTTGTGQPYVLATQENAVPAVMMPAAVMVAGAFPARVSYSPEELEMMTPEERSAYEAQQRRQSARVILERQPGQPEVGVPPEGEIPQAKVPEPTKPEPTAQVTLDGKPLAGKTDMEKRDSTQLLRLRPAKAVALRPEMDDQRVLEAERMAAEVNVGSAPVAGTGR